MNKKTGLDFKNAAKRIKPGKFFVRACSMCNYPCGFVFSPDHEEVGFDSGCDCTGTETIRIRTWDDIANIYNDFFIGSEDKVKADEFWGFNKEIIAAKEYPCSICNKQSACVVKIDEKLICVRCRYNEIGKEALYEGLYNGMD